MASRFFFVPSLLIAVAALVLCPSVGVSQANNDPGTGGIEIDAEGVLTARTIMADNSRLNRQRAMAAKATLNHDLATRSELRKISLNRLEAEVARLQNAGQAIPPEMKHLAGMTRITHVFYYPETRDIVIAGPAEGFFTSAENRVIGTDTGAATLHLSDLVVALRAFAPDGDRTRLISCSIDPTQEGLANFKQTLTQVGRNYRPGTEAQIVQAFSDSLGMQTISVNGVSPNTRFAHIMVEADYHMKLIGIGLEDNPVGIESIIEHANPNSGARGSLLRWFFQPNYDCVMVNEDETAMALVGGGVKLVGADESVANDGTRTNVKGVNRASRAFCRSFTDRYDRLAEVVPLYAELRNCIDMSIVAAFIQEMDLYGEAGWNMEVFGNEEVFPVEVLNAPTQVAPAINAVQKGRHLMTPIGGVHIQPRKALAEENLAIDDSGEIDTLKKQDNAVANLGDTQWWWD